MNKTENTTVEIVLVNLGNTGQFKYYDIQDIEDIKTAYEDMRKVFNADEIEIQGLSHSDRLVESLWEMLELKEETETDLQDIINIYEAVGCMSATQEAIKEGVYYYIDARDKEGAFIQYLEDINYFEGIPQRVINYLNYRMLMQDFQYEGLIIEQIGYTDTYLFVG